MSVREYIGARYVPLFSDPIQWDITEEYEPLVVVMNEGTSYVSKQSVPAGIQITNETYWLKWADYNAQLAAYQRTVETFDGRITANSNAIDTINADNWVTEQRIANNAVTNSKIADDSITNSKIATGAVTEQRIANNAVTNSKIADGSITNSKIADSSITNSKIATGAVTGSKIADSSINPEKLAPNNNIAVFGDSWVAHASSVPVDNCWIYGVQEFLNCETLYCYAKAGSGISSMLPDRNSVYSQAQAAVNELSLDVRKTIKHIFIMGGVNDLRGVEPTAAYLQQTLVTTLSYIRTNFPNAKVYLFSQDIFFEASLFNKATVRTYNSAYMIACRMTGCVFLQNFTSFFVGFGQSVYRPNDDSDYTIGGGTYHPNNVGNEWISYWVRQKLSGNSIHIPVGIEGANGFSFSENRSYTDGEFLYLDFKMTIPNNAGNGFINCGVMKWDNYPRCFYLGEAINGNQIMVANPQYFGNASYPNSFNASLWLDTMNVGNLNCFLATNHPTSGTGLRYLATHSINGY